VNGHADPSDAGEERPPDQAGGHHGGQQEWIRAGRCVLQSYLSSYTLSYQWLRELRRKGQRTLVAVHFRIDDDERVTVGHYNTSEPRETTAAEAIGHILATEDPRGYEIFLPRAVRQGELHRIRKVTQVTGWRYHPEAHGRRPCPCPVCNIPGTYKSAAIRAGN
jgi:hypothetical protein